MSEPIIQYSIGRKNETTKYHLVRSVGPNNENTSLCCYYNSVFAEFKGEDFIYPEWFGHAYPRDIALGLMQSDSIGERCQDCLSSLETKTLYLNDNPQEIRWIIDLRELCEHCWVITAQETESMIHTIELLKNTDDFSVYAIANILEGKGVEALAAKTVAPVIVSAIGSLTT